MGTRTAIAALVSAAAVLVAGAAPAAAAGTTAPVGCRSGCRVERHDIEGRSHQGVLSGELPRRAGTFEGERVRWSHFADNPRGNRWYFVRDSIGNTGWMYCGNLTAGC